MAIDASIYGRFAQPPRSALDYAQGFTQLGALQDQRQSAREQNALARLAAQQQIQAGEATQRRQNALQQLRQGLAGRPEAEVIEAMRSGGFFDEAGAAEKDYLGRQVLRADIGSKQSTGRKNEADAAKTETEAVGLALGQYQGLLAQVNNPQAARAWVQAQYRDPRVAPILAGFGPVEKALADIPDDPQAFGQWRDQAAMGIAKYQEMMAARQPKPAAPPASVAEYQFAKGEGYGGTYEQWVKDKARAGAASTSVNYSTPVAAVDANGNPVFIRTTKDGLEPAIVPGVRPPMSAAEERSASERSARERQARQMVSGLDDARKILDAGRATGSGIGNVVDAAARLFGQTTVGAQDAGRLEALSGWLVANVPRMEGPQSNFDVQNYTTMAGKVGDRTVPIAERKAALAEVERLQRKYAEINGTPIPASAPPAAGGGPFSDAEKERRYQEWKRQQGAR